MSRARMAGAEPLTSSQRRPSELGALYNSHRTSKQCAMRRCCRIACIYSAEGRPSDGTPCVCAAASSRFCVLELPYEPDRKAGNRRKANGKGLSPTRPEVILFNLRSIIQSVYRARSNPGCVLDRRLHRFGGAQLREDLSLRNSSAETTAPGSNPAHGGDAPGYSVRARAPGAALQFRTC